MLDIDTFKQTNDSRGHAAGDQLLNAVAALLMSRFPETYGVARIGGGGFAMVLPEATEEQAHTVASELRALLREHPSGALP